MPVCGPHLVRHPPSRGWPYPPVSSWGGQRFPLLSPRTQEGVGAAAFLELLKARREGQGLLALGANCILLCSLPYPAAGPS